MEQIVIIGAGLSGCVLACYLAQAGYRVAVYERAPDLRLERQHAGRSVGIIVTVRGLRAMDEVGVGDRVRERCIPIYGRMIHQPDATLTYQPYGNRQEANYAISRAELSLLLLEHAEQQPGVTFHFNEKCVDIDLAAGKVCLLNTKTGVSHEVTGSQVFGADGAFSAVRQAMQRHRRFNFSQEFSAIGYREITLPGSHSGALPFAVNAFHLWPRGQFVLLGFCNQSGSMTLTLMLPYEGAVSFAALDSVGALQNLLREHFTDVAPLAEHILPDVMKRPVESMLTIKCFPWVAEGKVALIGDASHAILPFYGQGANAGFEDSRVLMELLRANSGCWEPTLKQYQAQRKPNTDAIADLCQRHATELMDEVSEPKFQLRKRLELLIHELVPDYVPLYHKISFSCMPYADALREEQHVSAGLDTLMQLDDLEARLDTAGQEFWKSQIEQVLYRPALRT